MALYYNLYYKGNPLRPGENRKFYAVLRRQSKAGFNEVCEITSGNLGVNKELCKAIISCWNQVAIDLLLDGRSVDIGEMGSLHLAVSGKGISKISDLDTEKLKYNVKGYIRLSKKARKAVNSTKQINAVTLVKHK